MRKNGVVLIREQQSTQPEAAENVGTATQPAAGKENTNHYVNNLVGVVVKNTTSTTVKRRKKTDK